MHPMHPRRRPEPERTIPLGFKLWFAFCALVGLTVLGVVLWAIVRLVQHFTS